VKILVVEDEERIATFLVKGLSREGYDLEHVKSGHDALERAGGSDLVILDLGLPDIDGLDVLTSLRAEREDVQVIVLTARDGVDDRVEGLEAGADDYLVKPFAFEELLARVRARVRAMDQQRPRILRWGAVRMDRLARRVTVDGRRIDLSAREFELLEAFLHRPSEIHTREALLASVWGLGFDPRSNLVDVYVRYLRRKLGPGRIETVKGSGYRLAPDGARR
jgi:DNA-binding response OmpR family regulator